MRNSENTLQTVHKRNRQLCHKAHLQKNKLLDKIVPAILSSRDNWRKKQKQKK